MMVDHNSGWWLRYIYLKNDGVSSSVGMIIPNSQNMENSKNVPNVPNHQPALLVCLVRRWNGNDPITI